MTRAGEDLIIGADECGLGPLAGPLVVCAAVVPRGWTAPKGLNDSKKMTPKRRGEVYARLVDGGLEFELVMVSSIEIDRWGISRCWEFAFAAALRPLYERYRFARIIIDGTRTVPGFPQAKYIAQADGVYAAVMAASVVGKVNRDYLMARYHDAYPEYGFNQNNGYGGDASHAHTIALQRYGPCPLHRRSFGPIARLLEHDRPSATGYC